MPFSENSIEPLRGWPGVSVVMPVRNEAQHLAESLGSVLAQDYPGALEIVLAVGASSDDTGAVAQHLATTDPRVMVVDNPGGRTQNALNCAIAASSHPVVARVDAHGALPPDYLRRAVQILRETGAANVGGRAVPEGVDATQRAIAIGMASPLGMGSARFRVGGEAGPADTVFPGVFVREWIDRVGGFSAEYDRAQDWEMNLRIRQAGGVVWFSPDVCVTYRPRSSLSALAAQFFATGQWRRRLSQEHAEALNARYLAPPTMLVLVVGGAVAASVWRPLGLIPLGYAVAVAGGGVLISRGHPWAVRVRVPAVLATMHLSWGAGFLRGLPSRSAASDDDDEASAGH
ncbi:MAG: glycosyltransferase family 2 protein [Ornithinimicrobium sp.]